MYTRRDFAGCGVDFQYLVVQKLDKPINTAVIPDLIRGLALAASHEIPDQVRDDNNKKVWA